MRQRWAALACAGMMAAPALGACKLVKVADLPVTMDGPRPMVPAKIDSHEALFIADSGAFYSLISPSMAAAWKLPVTPVFGTKLQGLGGSTSLSVARVRDFGIAGATLHNMEFAVGGSDTGTAGLLGQNILGFADVEYDLAAGMIRLFKPADCANANLAYWTDGKAFSMLTIEGRADSRYHTVGRVTLNGVKLTATFDTGAPRSIVSLAAAARAGVKPGMPGVVPAGTGGGLGTGSFPVWRAHFASFGIGDNEEVRGISVGIGKLDMDDVDMLVGADFFLSHRVYVANSQRRLYVSYGGGPVFGRTTRGAAAAPAAGGPAAGGPAAGAPGSAAPDTPADPTDADGFARRGAARIARQDLPGGLADLDKAVALAPKDARFLRMRADLQMRMDHIPAARADLDAAIALQPDDALARLMRGWIAVMQHRPADALADADAVDRTLPTQDNRRLGLGELFEDLNAFDRSIAQYDQWLKSHAEDSGRARAFNGRCWSRALAGKELDRALADCNAALHLRPGTAQYLDSRGLVHLRRGEADAALADYDAALAKTPTIAWSLYGRSLIERARGRADAAARDEAAAIGSQADIAAKADRYGVKAVAVSR